MNFSFSQLTTNTSDFQTIKTYNHTSNFAIVHEFSSIIFKNGIQIVMNKGPCLIMIECKNTDIHWIFTMLGLKKYIKIKIISITKTIMKKHIKLIAIAVIVIAILYLTYNYLTINSNPHNQHDTIFVNDTSIGEVAPFQQGINKQIAVTERDYVCGDNTEYSNYYIREIILPTSCSQPVGLAIDDNNNIWIAAVWSGQLFVFDSKSNTLIKNISLPDWGYRGSFGSIIWDMKFDKEGSLWFTDQQSNSIWKYYPETNQFEKYNIPTIDSYPVSLVFDSQDRVWFTEIFGKKLGLLDPDKVEHNTTKGIKEFELPKDRVNFATLGPLSITSQETRNKTTTDNNDANNTVNDTLWFSTVNYPNDGQLVKFDINKENFTIYYLNDTKTIPISIMVDNNGTIWTNDHSSNLFVMFNPSTKEIKQYSTSPASTRNTTTTLPYYNYYYNEKIWFNEHEGNAIASYDPENKTLIEYHIQTRNPLWGNTSNPLKFAVDNNGSIWFTEWTENKIGVIKSEKINQLPIILSTSKDKIVLDSDSVNGKGDTIDLYLYKKIMNNTISNGSSSSNTSLLTNESFYDEDTNINMFVTSSMSKSGQLLNISGTFTQDQFPVSDISFDEPLKITLAVNSTSESVAPGNHTLTISARYGNDITYSKIIDLIIT